MLSLNGKLLHRHLYQFICFVLVEYSILSTFLKMFGVNFLKERVEQILKDFNIQGFQSSLIEWFLREKRALPWREDQDPYKVWVSEVMLQQTRVDTVIPYFHNFLEKFPTIEALANADEQELLKVWEGLGYYSRARNLQSAVKEVHGKYGGKVPASKEEFGSLKGVGPYTTGAVLSIAYGIPEPAVDGNVMRVLSRIFLIEDDIAKAKTRKLFEGIVSEIISKDDPSSFNQGLMELGALICKPKSPSCLLCPVREFCLAFDQGRQAELPVKTKAKKGKTVFLTSAVLKDDNNRILLRKRRSEGLLANLWEFPNEEVENSNYKNAITAFEEKLMEKHKAKVSVQAPISVVEHIFSHLKWNIQVYVGEIKGKVEEDENLKLVPSEKVRELPMPVSHQEIWKSYLDYLEEI